MLKHNVLDSSVTQLTYILLCSNACALLYQNGFMSSFRKFIHNYFNDFQLSSTSYDVHRVQCRAHIGYCTLSFSCEQVHFMTVSREREKANKRMSEQTTSAMKHIYIE